MCGLKGEHVSSERKTCVVRKVNMCGLNGEQTTHTSER